MLKSTALGVPRFSIMSDRRSSSTRFRSFPKFARAQRADTKIVPCLPVVGVADMNFTFQLSELYSLWPGESITNKALRTWRAYSAPVRPRTLCPQADGLGQWRRVRLSRCSKIPRCPEHDHRAHRFP